MDDAVWNHAVFSKNRDRLLNSEVAPQFFAAVVKQAKRFVSSDHFTVDGTLIQTWASQKSFRKKDGSVAEGTDDDAFLEESAIAGEYISPPPPSIESFRNRVLYNVP